MAMIAAVFCSCGQQPAQERGPRPVKLAEVTSLSRIEKSYSGVVSPDQFSDLAFKMSGPLVAMNVLEGQRVKKGQVVAEIDPTDYKLDYDAKRASFQKASSQMQRAEKLLAKNAISMQEFETTQASYTNAKSAFENAQNTLNDTKLRAPFDGFIQKKYVENYQRVQPGQGVVCLINPAKLQVEFTIPETNISYVTSPSTIYVEFDAYKGKLFQAKVKEYVEASPDGAGVPVFLYIDDPEFHLKHIVDQREQKRTRGLDFVDVLQGLLPVINVLFQKIGKSDNRIHRRSDVVTHVEEKSCFRLICRACFLCHLLQFFRMKEILPSLLLKLPVSEHQKKCQNKGDHNP